MERYRKLAVDKDGLIYCWDNKQKLYYLVQCTEESDMFPIEVKNEIRKEREKAKAILEMPDI